MDKIQIALEQSIKLIKQWHNMQGFLARRPENEIEEVWQIYYNNAPEMKPIKSAFQSVSEHSSAGDKMKERINYTKSGEYFIGESVNLPLIGQARTVEELKRMMQELFGTYLKRLQQTELEFVGFNQEDKKQQ